MALQLPPGVRPLPANPAPPLSDVDPAVRAERIRTEMDAAAAVTAQYVRRVYWEYGPSMHFRTGTAVALSIPLRTVTVDLDPIGGLPATQVNVGWGRPRWTAVRIVGKRVIVIQDLAPAETPDGRPRIRGQWIDVVTSP
jgi:hypothetical protein